MFKKISLLKQLAVIFIVVSLGLILVVVPVVDNNLKDVVDGNNYTQLKSAQNDYINFNFYRKETSNTKQIFHFIYNVDDDAVYPVSNLGRKESESFFNAYREDLKTVISSKKKSLKNEGEAGEDNIYYLITKDGDNYIISCMYSEYNNNLSKAFRQQVVYILYGAISVIAIFIFIWMYLTLKPLKKINDYIQDVKNNKESSLSIKRGDEIGTLATSLVDMKTELDKQDKIKSEMIHNISHDLKTPIALIETYTQSIKDGIYPYGDKDSSLDVILENARRLDSKVRSLLYLNRLDYLAGEEVETATDMKDLIMRVKEQFYIMHPSINIILDLSNVEFIGAEEHWRVCVENILENAYRYVKNNIHITLKDNYLEINNDGEAIDEDLIEQLFEPYRKGNKGEFGLGLSIVKKTVNLYGYQVEALNVKDGVSFIIKKDSK